MTFTRATFLSALIFLNIRITYLFYGYYYSAYSLLMLQNRCGPTTAFFTMLNVTRRTDDIVHTLREEILLITRAI